MFRIYGSLGSRNTEIYKTLYNSINDVKLEIDANSYI